MPYSRAFRFDELKADAQRRQHFQHLAGLKRLLAVHHLDDEATADVSRLRQLQLADSMCLAHLATGQARVGVQLQETSDLTNPDWQPVDVQVGDLDVGSDGTVGIRAPAKGRAKFFRVVVPKQ